MKGASLLAQTVKSPPLMQETQVWSLVWEDNLKKEMPIQPSILAWKIPWTEEPGRLQSMGSQRVNIFIQYRHTDRWKQHSFKEKQDHKQKIQNSCFWLRCQRLAVGIPVDDTKGPTLLERLRCWPFSKL